MENTCPGSRWPKGSCRPMRCGKNGSLEYKGHLWCKTHHPPTVKAKQAAKSAEWEAEHKAKQRQRLEERRAAALKEMALNWLLENRPEVARELEEKVMQAS